MGTEIKTWQIIDGKLAPIDTTLPDEGRTEPYDLEPWLGSNPEIIGTDIMLIGRQVPTRSGRIDLLGIDKSGNTVIIEIKRAELPRESLAQAIDYASDVAEWTVEELGEVCLEYTNKTLQDAFNETFPDVDLETVNPNSTQRIILLGFSIEASLERMIEWLSDSYEVDVNAVVISYVKTKGGEELLTKTTIISEEMEEERRRKQKKFSPVKHEDFVRALDQNGKAVFEKVFEFAQARAMPIQWGTQGFSLNVDLEGNHVAVYFCYPPDSMYKQSIYTRLKGQGGVSTKTQLPGDEITRLWSKAEATGLFLPAGHELRCSIDRVFTDEEIGKLLAWCDEVAATIAKYGPKE
ncbi:MAG: endonuclease NucS domain-containing protein [Terriglobia bacterium]|jgi:hypothetical protein